MKEKPCVLVWLTMFYGLFLAGVYVLKFVLLKDHFMKADKNENEVLNCKGLLTLGLIGVITFAYLMKVWFLVKVNRHYGKGYLKVVRKYYETIQSTRVHDLDQTGYSKSKKLQTEDYEFDDEALN
jgi:hypothetical protein